ncbi:RNA polymerase sigma-70 factor [Chitiniphilus purpureus]|uniref:RNA polymerase sigma-70 factor n=1 Tax=Chitiniphilus purpureus TaxID=2981137 RepID=A0ABY6DHX4_9NEIS|nr:RNA polymerase sigma-70 factor [Chitiniphilus sp. CD1]UXY13921.1 RNA polymerase sigma-70 factor [Chitiniphilus sp. CD1]
MQDKIEVFEQQRPRLFSLAYRMLGMRAEAEDVVQDAYLRWHKADTAALVSAEAWLVTVTTRLAIDRLRTVQRQRDAYPGPWLPEPLAPSPESRHEFVGEVSLAFLAVLERLGPHERAAFLLHEVFDAGYPQIAAMLDRSEAACRQMVHRARERVRAARPRFQVSPEDHRTLLARFARAAQSGDLAELTALFADEAVLVSDGGGKAVAAIRPLVGAARLARLFHVLARQRRDKDGTFVFADINGEAGLLYYADGVLATVYTLVGEAGRIVQLYALRNPDKLAGLGCVSQPPNRT